MKKKLVIIDFGAGNLKSVFNALQTFENVEVSVTNSADIIKHADFIVMPGVGAFDKAIKNLISIDGLINVLKEQVLIAKKPFLGICVGMQILADYGYENNKTKGLSFVKGQVKKMSSADKNLVFPHMGWNNIEVVDPKFSKFNNKDFYFVHSYYFDAGNTQDVAAYCDYSAKFPCILRKENIVATQFHPEKSGLYGIEFLKEFLNY